MLRKPITIDSTQLRYMHELETMPNSKILGYSFVKCLEDLPPMSISKELIGFGSQWFNGNELCDALDIGKPGWYFYLLVIGLHKLGLDDPGIPSEIDPTF